MFQNLRPSISEDNGLASIIEEDQKIYSVGISTGGVAEMRMALASATRHIIATTIDPQGAKFAKKQIKKAGLSEQIEVKLEDVSHTLFYSDGYFDFIYARLVLHYLPKHQLIKTLGELYRVLKPKGRIFVVVRSEDCSEAKDPFTFDLETRMTTYISNEKSYSRYFHSEKSIQNYLMSTGFQIKHLKTYEEQLCVDFQRTQLAEQMDVLIEVLAVK